LDILSRFLFVVVAVITAGFLGACGGGGSGAGAAPIPTGSPVAVSGTVRYERVGTAVSGGLNYSSITALPVRGATVELLYSGNVFATGQTNAAGQYSFSAVPGSSTYAVRVRAELKQTSGAAQWDTTVRDNTNGDALYTLQSANFVAASASTQNLTASSGWGGASYTSPRTSAPFAVLDTLYENQQKVLATQSNAQFPPLKAFWSINNNTTGGGQLSDGDVGTTFFTDVVVGGVVTERRMYLLGRANDDTDEFDSSVISHEWGHYYQSAFSRDNSMGGRHGGSDDRLDRRIAFSEGWGNAWSGIALAKSSYSDSSGPSQGSGFSFNLNTGFNTSFGPKGWFRETSIQYILWSLNNQVGFQGIHQALTSNTFRNGTALTDVHSFSAAYRSVASSTSVTALNSLLASESISNVSDAFGDLETNNGGNAATLPYYRQITALGNPVTLASGQTLCGTAAYVNTVNSTQASDGDRNKHGLYVYTRFSLVAPASLTITVAGSPTSGVDTDFQLFRAGQRVYVAETGVTSTESRTESLVAGDYVLVIYDYNKASPGNTCYTVSIQ
jgi:hypothetical protein